MSLNTLPGILKETLLAHSRFYSELTLNHAHIHLFLYLCNRNGLLQMQFEMEMDIAQQFILENYLQNQRKIIKFNIERRYIYRYCIVRTI